jgi:hypothetical protein
MQPFFDFRQIHDRYQRGQQISWRDCLLGAVSCMYVCRWKEVRCRVPAQMLGTLGSWDLGQNWRLELGPIWKTRPEAINCGLLPINLQSTNYKSIYPSHSQTTARQISLKPSNRTQHARYVRTRERKAQA